MALLCEQAVSYLVNHPNKKGKHRQGHTQDLTQANVEYSLSHNDGDETMLALKVIQTIKLGVPSRAFVRIPIDCTLHRTLHRTLQRTLNCTLHRTLHRTLHCTRR